MSASWSRACLAMVLAVVALAIFSPCHASPRTRPRYIDCLDSDECSPYECCSVGMGRFSVPTCRPRPELGDFCYPSSRGPYNTTVGYPNGDSVQLTNVFSMNCPCARGLTCVPDLGESICQDPAEHDNFNAL